MKPLPATNVTKPAFGTKVILFHFNQLTCATCHEDVHKGQFAKRMAVLDESGKPLGCLACHSTKEWKDLSKFDHCSNTIFRSLVHIVLWPVPIATSRRTWS